MLLTFDGPKDGNAAAAAALAVQRQFQHNMSAVLLGWNALTCATLIAAGALARIEKRGELRWAGDLQGGEPYVYRDPADPSKLDGFEVEIAQGLAKRLGVRQRFVQNDWSTLIPSLLRGDFDAAMNGIEDTPALRAQALVTRPYFTFSEQLVVRRGFGLRTLGALHGHRVGTLSGSLAHAILRETPGIQIVLYGGQEEPYRDLELGRTDAVLLDSVIASRYGLTKPDLELGDPDVARGTYVIAVRRGEVDLRDALDAALADLMARGQLESIFAKYHLPPQPSSGGEASAQAPARFDSAQVLLFGRGALVTLLVSLLSMTLAVPLGLGLALARIYGGRATRLFAHWYVELFRGTPVLLQLYLLYYGLAPLVHLDALTAAILGLGMNYAAYEAGGPGGSRGSAGADSPAAAGPGAPAAGAAHRAARHDQRSHLAPQGQLAGLGHHGGRADQADDHHRGGRALVGAAGPALRRPLFRDELPARAPGGASRSAPRRSGGTRHLAGGGRVSAIRVEGLRKAHGPRQVLRGIDAEVNEGETIALVGPSGGGKSTFLRCLNGLTPFDAGVVQVAGVELRPGTPPDAPELRALRARVGMVFQSFNLFPHLTAAGNVSLAPVHVQKVAPGAARARAAELLSRVGLADRADARPAELSGGQQQRVAIARALAMAPEILLLDEPTSALDPEMRGEVLAVLRDLARSGMTMLVVTHEMAFARAAASRVWVFDEGRLVEDGPPSEVCDSPRSDRARAFFGNG
jgi:polar amino acid transport system substrate-binding protein